jgi:hypothetical protein
VKQRPHESLPDTASFAGDVMRELHRRGGRAGVIELQDAMRATLLSEGHEASRRWERRFLNLFGWAILMLRDLGEVDRRPPSEWEPSGAFEALQPVGTTAAQDIRRHEWLEKWHEAMRDADVWDD